MRGPWRLRVNGRGVRGRSAPCSSRSVLGKWRSPHAVCSPPSLSVSLEKPRVSEHRLVMLSLQRLLSLLDCALQACSNCSSSSTIALAPCSTSATQGNSSTFQNGFARNPGNGTAHFCPGARVGCEAAPFSCSKCAKANSRSLACSAAWPLLPNIRSTCCQ